MKKELKKIKKLNKINSGYKYKIKNQNQNLLVIYTKVKKSYIIKSINKLKL